MERAHAVAIHRDPPYSSAPFAATFNARYKLAVLADMTRTDDGAKGALLRREGLYTSHISEWRRARDAGALAGLAATAETEEPTPEQRELAHQQRRAEKAEAELAKARLVIDIQGKASELLGRLLAESDEDQRQPR